MFQESQSVYSATIERRTVMSSGFPPAGEKKRKTLVNINGPSMRAY